MRNLLLLTIDDVLHFDKQSSNVSITTLNKGLCLFASIDSTCSSICR